MPATDRKEQTSELCSSAPSPSGLRSQQSHPVEDPAFSSAARRRSRWGRRSLEVAVRTSWDFHAAWTSLSCTTERTFAPEDSVMKKGERWWLDGAGKGAAGNVILYRGAGAAKSMTKRLPGRP